MTDQEWLNLIEDVREGGRYRYTLNQLYIQWQRARVLRIYQSMFRVFFAILLGWISSYIPPSVALVAVSALSLLILFPPFIYIGGIVFRRYKTRRLGLLCSIGILTASPLWFRYDLSMIPPMLLGGLSVIEWFYRSSKTNKYRFMLHLQRWKKLYRVKGLLIKPRLQAPREELQGDSLYNYEIKKILIVDQDLTVDFLTMNGFHEEESVLICSLQLYPQYTAQFIKRLLFNEEVVLFLLHRDGRSLNEVTQNLKKLGVRKHRIVHLGWRVRDRGKLVDHLGFTPLDWDFFAVDTLSPHSLFTGLQSALESTSTMISRLKPNGVINQK